MDWLVWFIYLVDVFDTLKHISGLFASLAAIMIFIFSGFSFFALTSPIDDSERELFPIYYKWFKTSVALFVVSLSLYVFIPQKNTMYYMAAAKATSIVLQSEEAKRIIPKSVELVEAWLDKHIEELKGGKGNE